MNNKQRVIKSFSLSEDQIEKINRMQDRDRRSASMIVEMAIEKYFEEGSE